MAIALVISEKKLLGPVTQLYNMILEEFGSPVTIQNFLASNPQSISVPLEAKNDIAHSSVVKWHEWGKVSPFQWPRLNLGELKLWRYSSGSYDFCYLTRDELKQFGVCSIKENWTCDIQEITGLCSSKSELTDFKCLDEMVESNSREMIDRISYEKLNQNLAHGEIRILHENSSDYFARYAWDHRLFLMNSGGSHHFAAARYIASRISMPVPLKGKLRYYSINPDAVFSLQREFDIFLLNDAANISMAFHHAMKRFRAAYIKKPLPSPLDDAIAIMLPHNDQRSVKVANVMREAGCLDLGVYLQSIA